MIEVIYKDEKQEGENLSGGLALPKNIRQIGQIQDGFRIYMEDYVYTFLGKAACGQEKTDENSCCLAVLTGGVKRSERLTCLFIRGALILKEKELSPEHVEFSDQSWQTVQGEAARFFEGQEIVGWFFAGRSLPMEMTDVLQRTHLKYFGGEKVLMLMDTLEQEEAFFHYENSFLFRQNGYYLYYEKNPQMQSYMMEKFPEAGEKQKEEIPDEAVREFRRIIQKKKEKPDETETEGRASVFSYAAAACLVLAVASVGVRFYQNYQRLGQANARVEAVSSSSVDTENGNGDTESGDGALLTSAPEASSLTEESASGEQEDETGLSPEEGSTLSSTEQITPDPSDSTVSADRSEAEKTETGEESGTDGTGQSGETAGSAAMSENGTASASETAEESGGNADTAAAAADGTQLSEEEQRIYREESDTRKAERRIQETKTEQDTGTAAGTVSSESAANTEDASSETAGSRTYVIRPGDTLYQISVREYGSMDEVEKICELNGFSEDEIIYPGQVIVLP